jgi:hypothetical protein
VMFQATQRKRRWQAVTIVRFGFKEHDHQKGLMRLTSPSNPPASRSTSSSVPDCRGSSERSNDDVFIIDMNVMVCQCYLVAVGYGSPVSIRPAPDPNDENAEGSDCSGDRRRVRECREE